MRNVANFQNFRQRLINNNALKCAEILCVRFKANEAEEVYKSNERVIDANNASDYSLHLELLPFSSRTKLV